MAQFQRVHPDAGGVYKAALREKADGSLDELKIEGREIFETDDKFVIAFLRKDPEIVEVRREAVIESDDETDPTPKGRK